MIFKTISQTMTTIVSATIFASFASSGAIAQVNNATTLSEQTLRQTQQQEQSPLSIGATNLNFSQLINQINLSGGKSAEQFRAEQSEALDDAVNTFRKQQRREIKISVPTEK
jgi:hypothetical protein